MAFRKVKSKMAEIEGDVNLRPLRGFEAANSPAIVAKTSKFGVSILDYLICMNCINVSLTVQRRERTKVDVL